MIGLILFLHILFFVFSFAFTGGLSIYLDRIAATHDRGVIHAAFRAARPLSLAGGVGWILTALLGAALAGMAGIPMGTPWLLYSYLAFAVLLVVGVGLHSPWQARVIAASAPSARGDLDALLHAPLHRIASALSGLSVLAILYFMATQPA